MIVPSIFVALGVCMACNYRGMRDQAIRQVESSKGLEPGSAPLYIKRLFGAAGYMGIFVGVVGGSLFAYAFSTQ